LAVPAFALDLESSAREIHVSTLKTGELRAADERGGQNAKNGRISDTQQIAPVVERAKSPRNQQRRRRILAGRRRVDPVTDRNDPRTANFRICAKPKERPNRT